MPKDTSHDMSACPAANRRHRLHIWCLIVLTTGCAGSPAAEAAEASAATELLPAPLAQLAISQQRLDDVYAAIQAARADSSSI